MYRVIESPSGPLLVYQWLDGELLGAPRARRDNPESAFQRFRSLPPATIQGSLDAIFDLHHELARAGWIAVDFYDGCLIYDFKSKRLGIVDLDTYSEGPFRNEMGRMFGSTRFMAPEEFELGALIDEQTNVFVMGRTALVFLSDGTLNANAFRGTRALFEVVARACEPERSRRYDSMTAFYQAWRAAVVAGGGNAGHSARTGIHGFTDFLLNHCHGGRDILPLRLNQKYAEQVALLIHPRRKTERAGAAHLNRVALRIEDVDPFADGVIHRAPSNRRRCDGQSGSQVALHLSHRFD